MPQLQAVSITGSINSKRADVVGVCVCARTTVLLTVVGTQDIREVTRQLLLAS
jgi:hypothetical protein